MAEHLKCPACKEEKDSLWYGLGISLCDACWNKFNIVHTTSCGPNVTIPYNQPFQYKVIDHATASS